MKSSLFSNKHGQAIGEFTKNQKSACQLDYEKGNSSSLKEEHFYFFLLYFKSQLLGRRGD